MSGLVARLSLSFPAVFEKELEVSPARGFVKGRVKVSLPKFGTDVQVLSFGRDETCHGAVVARNDDFPAALGFRDHGSQLLFELVHRDFFHTKKVLKVVQFCTRICPDNFFEDADLR